MDGSEIESDLFGSRIQNWIRFSGWLDPELDPAFHDGRIHGSSIHDHGRIRMQNWFFLKGQIRIRARGSEPCPKVADNKNEETFFFNAAKTKLSPIS